MPSPGEPGRYTLNRGTLTVHRTAGWCASRRRYWEGGFEQNSDLSYLVRRYVGPGFSVGLCKRCFSSRESERLAYYICPPEIESGVDRSAWSFLDDLRVPPRDEPAVRTSPMYTIRAVSSDTADAPLTAWDLDLSGVAWDVSSIFTSRPSNEA